jgi:hypothetical protein
VKGNAKLLILFILSLPVRIILMVPYYAIRPFSKDRAVDYSLRFLNRLDQWIQRP